MKTVLIYALAFSPVVFLLIIYYRGHLKLMARRRERAAQLARIQGLAEKAKQALAEFS